MDSIKDYNIENYFSRILEPLMPDDWTWNVELARVNTLFKS